jgi:large subunit ribosomal protein L1
MNKNEALDIIKNLRKDHQKKNFVQMVDLVINLQDLDFKKPEHQIDFYITLPHAVGKKRNIAALVDVDLFDEAKNTCDTVIPLHQFEEFSKDKKKIKRLAKQNDFFIAQSTIMTKIAATFGRVLGPKNKMPNPKAGCVVLPKTNLKPLYDKLQKTVRILARARPIVQVAIGREDMSDEHLAENLYTVYDQLIHHLPKERNNLKSLFIKTTMSPAKKVEV